MGSYKERLLLASVAFEQKPLAVAPKSLNLPLHVCFSNLLN